MTTKINASQLYSKKELLALMKVKGRAWDMLLTEVKKQLGLPPDATLEPRLEADMEGAFPEVFMKDYLFMESPDKPAASARCIIVAGGMPNEEGGGRQAKAVTVKNHKIALDMKADTFMVHGHPFLTKPFHFTM